MTNSAKNVNIKCIDTPVDCYYSPLKKKSVPYKFYRAFTLNDEIYTIQNFAVAKSTDSSGLEVVKLICIFADIDKKLELIVRKYPFARHFKEDLTKIGFTTFEEDNEVIEDFRKDYSIKVDQILRKCHLVFADQDDSSHIIKENNLNALYYFSCRYTLKADGFFPILSTLRTILNDINFRRLSSRPVRPKEQKRKQLGSENTPIDDFMGEEHSSETRLEKMKSSKNVHENNSISLNGTELCSSIQRHLVKRNLNESFDISPSVTNTSILNYSIVSDEDIENPFVLKLQISEKNKTPLVLIKKLGNDVYSTSKKADIKEVVENSPVRRSSRIIQKKTYPDYISPNKYTPSKREISYLGSESEDVAFPGSTKRRGRCRKTQQQLGTPAKSLTNAEDSKLVSKEIKTPKMYQDSTELVNKKSNLPSGVKIQLEFTKTKGIQEEPATPKSSRKSKRQKGASPIEQTDKVIYGTPEKEVDLDASMRRSVLELGFNKEIAKRSKSNRNYYESSESDITNSDFKVMDSAGTSPVTPRNRRGRTKLTCSVDKSFSNTNELLSVTQKYMQTPKSRAKLIKDGIITPSMHSRSNTVEQDSTPLMMARSQLHVSYVPRALPCREKEYCDIFNFVEGKLLDGCGGCMYISGVPGTGKTATVTSVINNLLQKEGIPKFCFVNVNGMRLTEPRQSYVEIFKQLHGKTLPWEQAQSMLEDTFSKSHKQLPVVMLIDELDILCTKRQDVVYNLLDLPSKAKNQLIVITIANTMDLPERLLMSRVTSRLGLTRLTFQAYTHKQLQEIVTKRISGNESFNSDAIQFVARKVASVSGDARRALDICRRAAEIAEAEGKSQVVTMNHVNEALNAMITQPKVRAIKNCSRLEQLILQSIVAEVERTGVEETTFSDVYKMLISCAAIEGFQMVSNTNALSAVSRLSACRLLLSDPKCNDITQKLILNVGVDDVYYALKRV